MDMKTNIKIVFLSALSFLVLASCQKDNLSPESVIKESKTEKTELDYWLDANFLNPYNIAVTYRYQYIESNMNYYTIPTDYDCAVVMSHIVKYLCIDTYDEVAGVEFTRSTFPKSIAMFGEWLYNNNSTFILGYASSGKKFVLTGVNDVMKHVNKPDELNHYYIKTIHHEFTHILNQLKNYQTDFSAVTGASYVADSWSVAPNNRESVYRPKGFISDYAQHSAGEDFAEMVSIYITHTAAEWEEYMKKSGTEGRALIDAKLDLVKAYLQESWNINLDLLRDTILRRQDDISNGLVDLTDLSLN